MSDKIKVIYNWIGPRGPMWNTEVPNVLNLASVAEGGTTNSTKWWSEENWNKIFITLDKFELCASAAIQPNDLDTRFILPFTLTWRIAFEYYFFGSSGILEFSHTPFHISNLVRYGKGYISINHSLEAFLSDGHLNSLHGYFETANKIPMNKIIYITGCMNSKEIYEDYCSRYQIPNEPSRRLTIISYPSSIDIFAPQLNDEPYYDAERLPPKLFLMWNRRYKHHRIDMALHLELAGLVDRSFISFTEVHPEFKHIPFTQAANLQHIQSKFDYITEQTVSSFASKLPLILDNETEISNMCADYGNKSRRFYKNSLVSLVTETNYREVEVTLTEKSFKPIKEKHPFIIIGGKGVLQSMRELGFKTFSEFWDESYDECANPEERMRRLYAIVQQIGSWTPEQIVEFRRSVKPILDYNFQKLKNFFGSKLTAVSIADIINGIQT